MPKSHELAQIKKKEEVYKVLQYYEPRHDKTNKVAVRPAKTQIGLGIRPV